MFNSNYPTNQKLLTLTSVNINGSNLNIDTSVNFRNALFLLMLVYGQLFLDIYFIMEEVLELELRKIHYLIYFMLMEPHTFYQLLH